MGNFIGAEKIAALGEGPRYRVYQDKAPCHHCREGGTWAVLDTAEDILIGGISYHQEEDAEWLADQLNDAVAAERARIRRELEDWLIGNIDPRDAGLINSRRIADEIKRICPEEG